MAHAKKAKQERKGLKKGKKMEAVKPLTFFKNCTSGVHWGSVTIST